ncbi:IS200/IS605 family transposase [Roseivirga sp. BDSF3-8]|uniref:IS200/IS605 family transposase n=1 Tax=Roseivirga sp. BDSF3-8 TaxID=3241598 RepID=UPI003531E917
MNIYTRPLYHLVFSTAYQKPVLHKSNRSELFRYITGILKNRNCTLLRINGVDDHVHILLSIPTDMPVNRVVRDIKNASTRFIKEKELFPDFRGWESGFCAFTVSAKDKEQLIMYIRNQEEHHRYVPFEDERQSLLIENGLYQRAGLVPA